jgi:tetratricopeptide (TPR) repeat protein
MRLNTARDQSGLKGKVQQDTACPRWDAEYPVPLESHEALIPEGTLSDDSESTIVDPGDSESTIVEARESAPVPKSPPQLPSLKFEDICEPATRLLVERRWAELAQQYGALADRADDPQVKAAHLRQLAEVQRENLEDPPRAFETLLDALRIDSGDEAALDTLEDLAALLRCIPEFLETVEVAIYAATSDQEALQLLERAVHSASGMLGEDRRLDRYIAQIRGIAPRHPAVERRVADLYAGCDGLEAAHEALERARIRATSNEEKRDAHVALGRLYETMPDRLDASRAHFVKAYELDRSGLPALEGLERVLFGMRKFEDVALVLERLSGIAPDKRTRERALLRLALLHEHHFQNPDTALSKYQRVLTVNAQSREARAGIDRCFERMHAWDELVHELGRRATLASDPREKANTLAKLARLHETRLLDADSAMKALLKAHALDDENKPILFELARLSEKNCDYPAAAAYRARLAQLTGDPNTRVQMYIGIGLMLSTDDRDPVAARLHFERAVALDASNVAAWEHLQTLAASAGEAGRTAEALRMRAEHATSKEQQASLYMELAELQKVRGLSQEANDAYAKVLASDPENKTAARALLDEHVRNQRWRDALPLCELLMNSTRDSFELFEQGARLALTCDDPARALTAQLSAFELRPRDEGARGRVIDLAYRLRADADCMAAAQSALLAIAEDLDGLQADPLFKLGALALSRGDTDAALAIFEHLLSQAPHHRPTLSRMGEIYMARGDWPRAAECKRTLAEGVESSDEKFRLLVETGEILAHRAQDYEGAAEDFETARTLRPDDRILLNTQLANYKELGQWDKVASTLRELANFESDPKLKAKGIFAMAQVVETKVGDVREAAELFDEVVALDRSRLDAFEHIARIYSELRDWEALSSVHHALLGRLEGESTDQDLRQNLYKRLGLIYRDRVVDAKRSLQAFRSAMELREEDEECRRYLSDLLVVTGDLDGALELTMCAVKRNPMAPEPLQELYTLFLRKYDFDRAWCAVDVLGDTLLSKLSADQERFCVSYPPTSLDVIPGTLVATAWDSHILHPELDPILTSIFRIAMPAVIRGKLAAVPRHERESWLGSPVANEGTAAAYPLIRTFLDAAEVLGVSGPELRINSELRGPFAVAVAERPTLHVSMEFAQDLSPASLAFLAGKYIALLQPELIARAVFPTITELEALLRSAVRVATGNGTPSENDDELDTLLLGELSPDELLALRGAALTVVSSQTEINVARWANLVDLSASRAGLLLAGSVESARRASVHEPRSAGDFTVKEWVSQLILFSVSNTYAELRAALGIGVRTDEERAAFVRPELVDELED